MSLKLLRALGPLALAFVLVLMAGGPHLAYSSNPASDRTARHQETASRGDTQPDSRDGGGNQDKSREAGQSSKADGANKKDESDSRPPRPSATPATNAIPEASATPGISVSIAGISVDDPCRVSGVVSLSGPYRGSLTLSLTYHVTAASDFLPTGSLWSGTFTGQTSAAYNLPLATPSDVAGDSKNWVNSYRVEIASADPEVGNMTAKSTSFWCGEQPSGTPAVPTATPTATATATIPATGTATATVPSATTAAVPATSTATPTTGAATAAVPPVATATVPATATATATAPVTATAVPAIATATVPVTNGDTDSAPGAPAPTATPSAPRVQNTGSTDISPDNAVNADPGTTVTFHHTVVNRGWAPDTKEITAISSQGWVIGLFAGDGTTPLADSNGNGTTDTGTLVRGQSVDIVVKVTVPAGAPRNAQDVTTVTAASAGRPGPDNSDSATDTTRVNAAISLSLSVSSVTFGLVSPTGAIDPGAGGVSSSTDSVGAYYVKSGGLQVTVTSNTAWKGNIVAQENNGTASTIRIADGDLEWRLAGDSGWTAFSTDPSSTFAAGSAGDSRFEYDYRLHILWDDDPGSFNSVITYDVTQ